MTSSTVVVHAVEHLFKVVGHSQITVSNARLTSDTFRVGGHDWAILYYPNGDVRVADDQYSSLFLKLMNAGEDEEVTASYCFCLQDPAAPATGEKHKRSFLAPKFTSTKSSLGADKFVSKADLAASGCLKDDCLVIKCTVQVSELIHHGNKDDHNNIVVPSPSLGTDLLQHLLQSGLKADLTVKIASFSKSRKSKSFKVHACLLAARSPVFRAQLCGSMKESKQSSICIKGMDARVFEVLLHYMYTDRLPEFMEETTATEEASNMAQNLLISADRYAMERLKLLCESKLSKALAADTVCSTLDLALQYNCPQLKDSCLKYMATDRDRLRDIKETEEFQQLKKKHPSIIGDILDQVIEKLN